MTAQAQAPRSTLLPEQVLGTLAWQDLHDIQGVRTKVLWQAGGSLAGLMALEPGAALASHRHTSGHHHILVRKGTCQVGGTPLPEGSYAHVAAGEPHDIANRTGETCELFYLFLKA